MKNIISNIEKWNNSQAIKEANNFLNLTLKGIDYILHYDRDYSKTTVSSGYILWVIYLLIFVKMKNEDLFSKFFFYNSEEKIITIINVVIIIGIYLYIFLRRSPFLHFMTLYFLAIFFGE